MMKNGTEESDHDFPDWMKDCPGSDEDFQDCEEGPDSDPAVSQLVAGRNPEATGSGSAGSTDWIPELQELYPGSSPIPPPPSRQPPRINKRRFSEVAEEPDGEIEPMEPGLHWTRCCVCGIPRPQSMLGPCDICDNYACRDAQGDNCLVSHIVDGWHRETCRDCLARYGSDNWHIHADHRRRREPAAYDVFAVTTVDRLFIPFAAYVDTACAKSCISDTEFEDIKKYCKTVGWPWKVVREHEPFRFGPGSRIWSEEAHRRYCFGCL